MTIHKPSRTYQGPYEGSYEGPYRCWIANTELEGKVRQRLVEALETVRHSGGTAKKEEAMDEQGMGKGWRRMGSPSDGRNESDFILTRTKIHLRIFKLWKWCQDKSR